jgi:hypothetical protein
MLATFASLILLVQHVSTMLQAPNIPAAAGEELLHEETDVGIRHLLWLLASAHCLPHTHEPALC